MTNGSDKKAKHCNFSALPPNAQNPKSTQLNLIILESARHTYQKTVQAKRDGTDTNFLVIDVDSFNISHHVSIISIDSSLHRSQIGCLSLFFESQIHYHPAGD